VPSSRPVYLNLLQIRMPVPAIASILHRLSGVLLFLLLPAFLLLLHYSLNSAHSFACLQECLQYPLSKFVLWVMLSSLLYHLIAGIRHLIMDAGFGESLTAARWVAYTTLTLNTLGIICLGIWLW